MKTLRNMPKGDDFSKTRERDVGGSLQAETVVEACSCGCCTQRYLRKDCDDGDNKREVIIGCGAVTDNLAPANPGGDGIN